MELVILLAVVSGLVQSGHTAPLGLLSNNLKQRIAFRIGQVECLKTLLSGASDQYGLGALHRGNYSSDISTFDANQRIAFLLGQVQCLKMHLRSKESPMQPPPVPKPVLIDCRYAYQSGHNTSGIYTINPDNQTPFRVYCDMDTDGGGWTVFHRRMDGSVEFQRNWTDYETGFGNLNGEYWLGLNKIYRLTSSSAQELRVDLEEFGPGTAFALYRTFSIASATDKYRLLVSDYSGTARDCMGYNSGQQFTTIDQDNDAYSTNCAVHGKGPWWYKSCSYTKLNSKYYNYIYEDTASMNWYHWKGWRSLKSASMMMRRKQFTYNSGLVVL